MNSNENEKQMKIILVNPNTKSHRDPQSSVREETKEMSRCGLYIMHLYVHI
jgi:hypothetical protein